MVPTRILSFINKSPEKDAINCLTSNKAEVYCKSTEIQTAKAGVFPAPGSSRGHSEPQSAFTSRCFLIHMPEQDSRATESNATLGELGARVRAWRARRGMTRKALASDSGLSERFLADVESGKGNVSINSLEATARALNISILDLLQDAPRPALARVQALLARLDDSQLDQAYALLGTSFGLADAQGREQRIALVGLRG